MCEGKQIKMNLKVRIPAFNEAYQTVNLVLTKSEGLDSVPVLAVTPNRQKQVVSVSVSSVFR